jgi:hypothetical protein
MSQVRYGPTSFMGYCMLIWFGMSWVWSLFDRVGWFWGGEVGCDGKDNLADSGCRQTHWGFLYIYKGAIVFMGILLVQFCILMKANLHVQLWFWRQVCGFLGFMWICEFCYFNFFLTKLFVFYPQFLKIKNKNWSTFWFLVWYDVVDLTLFF